MQSISVILASAALAAAQNVPPPDPVLLTATKSGVLPVLPPAFTGVQTLEGAIIQKAPVNSSYTGVLGPAQVQSNLPAATYTATLPSVAFDALTGTTISGTVTGSSNQGASGTTFTINLQNLPDVSKYGPFVYHIHDMPVPADGNCTSTMGHLDTTNVGEYYTCDTANPQNCQTGDLAGKHGKISAATFQTSFVDNYLSTDPSSPYFFGSKSIVIHTSNTTRLTCANFVQSASGSTGGSNGSATGTPYSYTPTSTPGASYTGGATKVAAGSVAVGGVFAALMAFL